MEKTAEEIIQSEVGIKVGAPDLTPMDYLECIKCMNVHASQYKSRIEELELTSKAKSDVIDTASHMIIELREEIESQRKRIEYLKEHIVDLERAYKK